MGRLASLTLRPTEFWNHSEKVGRQARFLNGEGPGLFLVGSDPEASSEVYFLDNRACRKPIRPCPVTQAGLAGGSVFLWASCVAHLPASPLSL
jgi:hypothetical protein